LRGSAGTMPASSRYIFTIRRYYMFHEKLSEILELPQEVRDLMASLRTKLGDLPELQNDLFDKSCEPAKLKENLEEFAKSEGIHEYTLAFYLLFISAEKLHGLYREQNIPENIFVDSIKDLQYKLVECKALHNIWGTFVLDWYPGFYRLTRFALGRFQYDIITFPAAQYTKHGFSVQKGDTVYNCHIPSCGPLTKELRMDSYKKACEFFGKKPIVIVCDSWLLYPPHREFLQNPGILGFMDDFEIMLSAEQAGFPDAWRVFGSAHTLPPEEWPRDTSLQRTYAERIILGKPTGWGRGILIFDGENIVN